MSNAMVDENAAVASYFEAWNADPGERPALVAAVFSEDAYYCDGAAEANGHAEITKMMDATMTQFAGARFELTSPIDRHHAQARFAWRMLGADDVTIVDGIDVVRFAESGQITDVLGFFGVEIPTAADRSTAHTFRWERTYDVEADRLFALVSDLQVYADVAPNLASVDVLEGEGVGMVRKCTNPEGESWTETYAEWVPGERFKTVVDVSTYPPSLASMIDALAMTVTVDPIGERQSRVVIEIDTELTAVGLQVFRDGGAADGLFHPILDGWARRLEIDR